MAQVKSVVVEGLALKGIRALLLHSLLARSDFEEQIFKFSIFFPH